MLPGYQGFSILLLAFVVGPLFLAAMSEVRQTRSIDYYGLGLTTLQVYGRVVVLQLASIWFLIFCLACGFAQTESESLPLRFLRGSGGCAP